MYSSLNGFIYYDITASDEIDKGLYTFGAFITFNDAGMLQGSHSQDFSIPKEAETEDNNRKKFQDRNPKKMRYNLDKRNYD
jgi:hypothetical protein